jgi:hypothetical protein
MAFSRAPPGGTHPTPWRAAEGGFSYDVEVELSVPKAAALPGGLDTEGAIWWIAALMRLAHYPYLLVPVISDQPFSQAATAKRAPLLSPFETQPRIWRPAKPAPKLEPDDLEWVKKTWVKGADLLKSHPKLNTAVRALDSSAVRGKTSTSLLAVWGALEQLFSPTPGELRFRVSSNIAAYLQPPGLGRLALYKEMIELYNKRSKAAHTAEESDVDALVQSFVVLRNALVKMIESNEVPTQSHLEAQLFTGLEANEAASQTRSRQS